MDRHAGPMDLDTLDRRYTTILCDVWGVIHDGGMLLPGAKAPVAVKARGRQVCTCFNVTEPDLLAGLQTCQGPADQQFAHLQSTLKCGTNCGSCIPEVKRIVMMQLKVA